MKKIYGHSGFTLIELLIVVLIIAILAAIAVPNFLEFQTRAKVSRVKSDLRNVATALEAYYVDNNEYPVAVLRSSGNQSSGVISQVTTLSTPIAYFSSVDLPDPFVKGCVRNDIGFCSGSGFGFGGAGGIIGFSYFYVNIEHRRENVLSLPAGDHFSKWLTASIGPDAVKGPNPYSPATDWAYSDYAQTTFDLNYATDRFITWEYDPTNGTVSAGDVTRWAAGRQAL